MEQDQHVYEYKLDDLNFVFEAGGETAAKKYQAIASAYFAEKLNRSIEEKELEGPFRINEFASARDGKWEVAT